MEPLNDEELIEQSARQQAEATMTTIKQEQFREAIRARAAEMIREAGITPPAVDEHWQRQEEMYFEQLMKQRADRIAQRKAAQRFVDLYPEAREELSGILGPVAATKAS